MSVFEAVYKFGAVREPAPPPPQAVPGAAPDPTKFVYITKQSLTFPGVTLAAGVAATVVNKVLDVNNPPNLAVSLIVAAVVGGMLTWLAIAKATSNQKNKKGFWPETVMIAVFNTLLLMASIHGFAELSTTGSSTGDTTTSTTVVTTTTLAPN